MKKKVILLFLLVISLFIFVSCNTNSTNNSGSADSSISSSMPSVASSNSSQASSSTQLHEEAWRQGKTIVGNPIKSVLTDSEINEISALKESGLDKVNTENDYDGFKEIYDKLSDLYYKVSQESTKNEMDFYVYGSNIAMDKYLELNEIRIDLINWFNEVEHTAYHNSFKAKLFEGMTEEEILEYIGEDYGDEYFDLSKELSRIKTEAESLDSRTIESKFDNLYAQYFKTGNDLAKYLNYDNFMEYAYPNIYSRDFSIEDTDSFFENVYNYVIPAYLESNSELKKITKKLTSEETKVFNSITKDDIFLGDFELVEDYVNYIGGIMKEEFDKLFTDGGNYFISYEKAGYGGAFENDYRDVDLGIQIPYVYYGPKYHSATTIVHEFGHYLANTQNTSTSLCYDLAETHSQANEFLFLEYLCQNKNYSENLKKAIMLNQYVDAYHTIIIASAVNEIEKMLYAKDTYINGDLLSTVKEFNKKYPEVSSVYSYLYEYARQVIISSGSYYISYATSLFGSLYIDSMAKKDFNTAKEAYFKIIENQDGYENSYEYAGLQNPFTEGAFIYIFGEKN